MGSVDRPHVGGGSKAYNDGWERVFGESIWAEPALPPCHGTVKRGGPACITNCDCDDTCYRAWCRNMDQKGGSR